jgi:hypothetical protein
VAKLLRGSGAVSSGLDGVTSDTKGKGVSNPAKIRIKNNNRNNNENRNNKNNRKNNYRLPFLLQQ